jgi:hypothetical protein
MIDKQVVVGPYRHRKNYLPFLCVGNVLGQCHVVPSWQLTPRAAPFWTLTYLWGQFLCQRKVPPEVSVTLMFLA